MKKSILLLLFILFTFAARAGATDIDIGATSSIPGFNTANAGADAPLTGVVVNLASPSVSCSSCLPQSAVGIGGMQITFSTGVRYTIATVTSRSAFTLTVNYAESSGTVTATLHKFVHLRIYALNSFIPSGSSTVVQAGAPGSSAWYRRYGVSIVNNGSQNVAFFPQVDDLPATTDSSAPTARYYAALYTPGGGFIQSYPGCVDDWRLSSTPTTTSWAQICTFNSSPVSPPPQPINFYTTTQIDSRFPSCSVNQLIYYAATGNVQTCLSLSGEFTISGGVLSLAAPATGYNRIQEEGSNLPQRTTLNFIGSSFTAADEVGVRTNVSADADLNAIASLTGTGFAQRTGVDTWALNANVVTGPASATDNAIARFDLTTGKILQNSAVTVADTSGSFTVPNNWALTNAGGVSATFLATELAFTTPTNGAATFPFNFTAGAQTQSSGESRTFRVVTTYNQTSTASDDSLAIERTETALGSGQHNFLRGIGGAAGSTLRFRINNLGNYFFGASGGFIGDENGNEYLKFVTAPSAVNGFQIFNSATGVEPAITAFGDDTNITFKAQSKGIGSIFLVAGSSSAILDGSNPAIYFGNGITSATPVTYTLNGTGGSGTNIAGANLDLATGKGTGNAEPGQLAVRYPLRGASGTALQSLSNNRFPVSSSLFSSTGFGTTVVNTTTETSLLTGMTSSADSTRTLEAGFTKAGTVYKIRLEANFATTGTPTIQFRIKLGSTVVVDSAAFNAPTGIGNGLVFIDCYLIVQSIGATGAARTKMQGWMTPASSGSGAPTFFYGDNTSSVDYTASQTLDVTVQWGTASASNSITATALSIERLR